MDRLRLSQSAVTVMDVPRSLNTEEYLSVASCVRRPLLLSMEVETVPSRVAVSVEERLHTA